MAAHKERASEKKLAGSRADLDATSQKLAQTEAALQVLRDPDLENGLASKQLHEHHVQIA